MYALKISIIFICALVWAGFTTQSGFCEEHGTGGTQWLETQVRTNVENVNLSIRNVDFTHFPEISMTLDVDSHDGTANLTKDNIEIFENNYLQPVFSLDKVIFNKKIPVDFVFVPG